MRNLLLKGRSRDRSYQTVTAVFALVFCLAAAAPAAFGQSTCPQPPAPLASDPLKPVIPVHMDTSTGDITVGNTTYCGQNPGFHLLAVQRQPNLVDNHLMPPIIVWDQTYTDAASVNNALQQIQSKSGGPLILINAVGSYGVNLNAVAQALTPFGAYPDLQGIDFAPSFIFVGNAGRNPQTALQRGGYTDPVDGYLAQDSNSNYTFAQMDFIRYDVKRDGSITVGSTIYNVEDSYRVNCDGQNAFHIVVLDGETLQLANANNAIINNTYCTAQSDFEIARMVGDMSVHIINANNPGLLVFIASNGHPIPANVNFGTDGDARIYPFAQQVAKLGGYWETMVYLTPNDTYSLVGSVAPRQQSKARESSSVYPVDVNGKAPTGELHGMLARGRGNVYSPLNADPTGLANLDLYSIIAQPPVAFPHPDPNNPDEIKAFSTILQNVCKPPAPGVPAPCDPTVNPRNQYDDINVKISSTYQTPLQSLSKDPDGNDCNTSTSAYCTVRAQLLDEFIYVSNIRAFNDNVKGLWATTGTVTIKGQLSVYNDIKSTIPAPPTNPSSSLASPIVNAFLGLGSFLPEVGPVFGLADLFFNFGTALTTDQQGNKSVDLTSTIGHLEDQANKQFIDQATSTGTLFKLIYQDWGKLRAVGSALVSATDEGSPWYWSSTATSQMLNAMLPAIKAVSYQSLMPAAYSIGSYLPISYTPQGWGWGILPLTGQPYAYVVEVNKQSPTTPVSHPFWLPAYSVYSNPTDYATSGFANQPGTGTILADGGWLAISLQSTPVTGTDESFQYQPPDQSLLTTLFQPPSQGGLGVYRPVFFEGWSFPRFTCRPSEGDRDGYDSAGGCDWGTGKTEPPAPQPGPPVTSLGLQATQIGSNGNEIDVLLSISNNGTTTAESINLSSIELKTLTGSGQATLLSPSGPVQLSRLVPGDSTQVILKLDVPPSITKLSLTEAGSVDVGQSQSVQFSQGQALYPQR